MSKESRAPDAFIETAGGTPGSAPALKGDWTMACAAAIERALSGRAENHPRLDAGRIARLDTAGAWLIRKHFPKAEISGLSERNAAVLKLVPETLPEKPEKKKSPALYAAIAGTGEKAAGAADFLYALLSFAGAVFLRLLSAFAHPRRFRLPSVVRHVRETGLQALPVIALLALGTSMVIFYQGATQLRRFGADIYTIDLTVISLLREMAVLTTAIMVAGRSGSAFAAEIGVMKLRGEVDALRTMGLDPLETLVVPRLLALLLTLPLLTFLSDAVGLAGGGVMALMQLKIHFAPYAARVRDVATPTMFSIGMIKAPVFALLITLVCTFQGLSVSGSAESVGKLTTLAVVQSIFLVMAADALFSVVFSRAGL